jgi:hypothetical protein
LNIILILVKNYTFFSVFGLFSIGFSSRFVVAGAAAAFAGAGAGLIPAL